MSAGYSDTPLPRKLGIKEGHRVATFHAPESFPSTLGELPPGVCVEPEAWHDPPFDVVVLFAREPATLGTEFSRAAALLQPNGGLWVGWPKRTSSLAGALTGGIVRSIGLEAGLVDNKICAIDRDWSGLRFVYRLKDRPPDT